MGRSRSEGGEKTMFAVAETRRIVHQMLYDSDLNGTDL